MVTDMVTRVVTCGNAFGNLSELVLKRVLKLFDIGLLC